MELPYLSRRTLLTGGALALMSHAAERIRLGCQTRAYGSPLRDRAQLLAALSDLHELGYEGFETNFNSLLDSFMDPQPARMEIEKRGLPLIGLHMGAGLFDPSRIEKEQEQIAQVAQAAKDFGGSYLMLSGNGSPQGAAALRRKCEELNRAGRACLAKGVRLCSHNHVHELEHDAAELKAVFKDTDPQHVSVVLDVGHVFPPDFSVPEIIRRHGKRIPAFHLRDTVQEKEVLFGSGEFDFAKMGEALRETKWTGWLIVEVNRDPKIASRKLAEMARDYVRKTMKI